MWVDLVPIPIAIGTIGMIQGLLDLVVGPPGLEPGTT